MERLFKKVKLKNIELKNRFIRSATVERISNKDGSASEDLYKLYRNLAEGEVGTIITGYTYVDVSDKVIPHRMSIADDRMIPGYQRICEMLHRNSTHVLMQIGSSKDNNDINSFTKEDIHGLITVMVSGAIRAQKSGFDGIQLLAAHGSLLSRFGAESYNKRYDEYGFPEGRFNLLLQIFDAIREVLGDKFQIWLKISCTGDEEALKWVWPINDCLELLSILKKRDAGLVEISGGNERALTANHHFFPWMDIKAYETEAYYRDTAQQLVDHTDIPLALSGGIRSLSTAKELLDDNISFISMARPFIAEPDLIKRWRNGDTRASTCISCNKCLYAIRNYPIYLEEKQLNSLRCFTSFYTS